MRWTLTIPTLATAALAIPSKRQEDSINGQTVLSYNETVILHHNMHRQNHSSVDLSWDEDLAITAQKIANNCNFEHDVTVDGGGYGQNLAAGPPADNVSYVISDLWYNGEAPAFAGFYNMSQPPISDSSAWGHFTQVVWNGTLTVGCATQHCTGGLNNTGSGVPPYLTVCNYKDAGNVLGLYASNIGEPLGHPTATWANSTEVSSES